MLEIPRRKLGMTMAVFGFFTTLSKFIAPPAMRCERPDQTGDGGFAASAVRPISVDLMRVLSGGILEGRAGRGHEPLLKVLSEPTSPDAAPAHFFLLKDIQSLLA
jgi:hypothetical protein